MIILPIPGDRIKTSSGLPAKVLSYTNYKLDGPAVIVDGPDELLYFKDIKELNDQKVKLIKNAEGYNVLETDGYLERKFHLPQVGEFISSDISGVETRSYEVLRLRLHIKDQLSRGLVLDVKDKETGEELEIPISKVKDIDHYIFSQKKFLEYYSDYRAKGTQ